MLILGIDPGPRESGWVVLDCSTVLASGHDDNTAVLHKIRQNVSMGEVLRDVLFLVAIERIRGYGIVAGNDTFDTCEWVGRFDAVANCGAMLIPRKEIKLHLCGNTTARDPDVRQALIDRIGVQGTKKAPGPLFGIAGHMWAALAVAVVAGDRA